MRKDKESNFTNLILTLIIERRLTSVSKSQAEKQEQAAAAAAGKRGTVFNRHALPNEIKDIIFSNKNSA
jgi:hypothetical protein